MCHLTNYFISCFYSPELPINHPKLTKMEMGKMTTAHCMHTHTDHYFPSSTTAHSSAPQSKKSQWRSASYLFSILHLFKHYYFNHVCFYFNQVCYYFNQVCYYFHQVFCYFHQVCYYFNQICYYFNQVYYYFNQVCTFISQQLNNFGFSCYFSWSYIWSRVFISGGVTHAWCWWWGFLGAIFLIGVLVEFYVVKNYNLISHKSLRRYHQSVFQCYLVLELNIKPN